MGDELDEVIGVGIELRLKAEPVAQDQKLTEPIGRGGVARLRGSLAGGSELAEQLVVSILGFPEIQFEGEVTSEGGNVGGAREQGEVVGVGGEAEHDERSRLPWAA